MHGQIPTRIVDQLILEFTMLGILVFVLVITLVVTIHEFGHYLACRLLGIRVNKFAVGVGKPLLKFQREGGTEWSIRPIPLGGFIEPNEFELAAASPLSKAIVFAAGPLANLLPFAVLAVAIGKLGLFFKIIGLLYWTGVIGLINTLTLPIRWMFSIPEIGQAVQSTQGSQNGDLVGPIGIGHIATQMTHDSGVLVAFLMLFIILSLGVALMNLIPIMPLDGGRVLLAAIEGVVGKKRIAPWNKALSRIGIVLVLTLFVIITARDLFHLL